MKPARTARPMNSRSRPQKSANLMSARRQRDAGMGLACTRSPCAAPTCPSRLRWAADPGRSCVDAVHPVLLARERHRVPHPIFGCVLVVAHAQVHAAHRVDDCEDSLQPRVADRPRRDRRRHTRPAPARQASRRATVARIEHHEQRTEHQRQGHSTLRVSAASAERSPQAMRVAHARGRCTSAHGGSTKANSSSVNSVSVRIRKLKKTATDTASRCRRQSARWRR